MTEKRRQFSPQFKAEAVQMVVGLGRSLAAVARDLEINPGTLGNWVKAWREENSDPATASNDEPCGGGTCGGDGVRNPQAADGERVSEKAAAFFARTHP